MNVWGKVFAFLVVICAIVASIFTAKLVQVRNSWTAKSVASKAKYDDLKPKIAALEAQIEGLKNDLFRSRDLWGNFWPNVQTGVTNPQDGTVQVSIGSDQLVREKLLLHGFQILPDGTSVYRGSFLPTQIQNGMSLLKPNWRATPEEVKTWEPAGIWRWRNLVPPGYEENFDKQLTAILKLEETLNDRLKTLAGQKELLADANAKLKLREAELVGGDELTKGKSVDPEFRDGLVAAIAQAEEERNRTLLEVDALRRKNRSIETENKRILAENVELSNRLPQPASKSEITLKK